MASASKLSNIPLIQEYGLKLLQENSNIVTLRRRFQYDFLLNVGTPLQQIVDFTESWIRSGTMVADYQRLLPRVQANKKYFHSEEFRTRIMIQRYENFK